MQVNSLSVQSRYNAVEAWFVLRHRSHVGGKAPLVEHRRSVPEQRSVRRSCCGSLRGCWRRWRGTRPRLAHLGAPETPTPQPAHATQDAQQVAEGVLCWHPRVDAEHAGGRGATRDGFADSRDPRCRWPALG